MSNINHLNFQALEMLEKNPNHFLRGASQHFSYKTEDNITGERFHLLIQQMGLGLNVDPLLKCYPQMKEWVEKLKPIIGIPASSKRWEAVLQKLIGENLLLAQYNLIIETGEQAIGIDWSISRNRKHEHLEQCWHTQLNLNFVSRKRTYTIILAQKTIGDVLENDIHSVASKGIVTTEEIERMLKDASKLINTILIIFS
ncbi:hypothetical protein WA1_25175 [Scytonema hofmannii PCC 7110]|uniref:Uncharacterized protein n=1 Tax=Scytonema hofmannii PCC 7110 TaxID=128403 RepID=A0A139X898_9CYAN|nr:hypothetical protein [Scytonema hofmannii]KYC40910.1 hypothetical protein WA1_25175 [Scytonema hofmannii PCC 7110]